MQGRIYKASLPSRPASYRRSSVASGQTKRVYQVWKGRNKFFLGGRLIFGPDVKSMFLTILLIIIPVLLFTVFVSQNLVNEFQHYLGEVIVGIPIGFAFYDILLLLFTSGTDPGIIPRNSHPPDPGEDDASNFSWTGSHGGLSSVPPFKDVIVNGILVRIKYCHTCMLYRPPRCSHCSICNNCVERFDHHCPWIGQCIGKRNYRFFFLFILSTTILCFYILSFCCVNLKSIMKLHEFNLWEALMKSPVSGILLVYTFIVAWFVGGLTCFHTYLICTNQTTYENFRYRYDGKLNSHNQGCSQNVSQVLCSRIPISKINFRARVEDVDVFSTPVSSEEMSKSSFDLEMSGKQLVMGTDEFEVTQSHSSLPGPGLHSNWDSYKENWELTQDFESLAADSGMERGFAITER
ncbi:hypothetical protein HPP92_006439 [Vanilla planifolia]|uniref:S-acyltransferase n=1 Tax=Vanilla planifolia TaxID=51239 RepID=A0A835RJ24_VANPL|nr:hypothetical protein HPP92_006439 [Vanilla planifolia]